MGKTAIPKIQIRQKGCFQTLKESKRIFETLCHNMLRLYYKLCLIKYIFIITNKSNILILFVEKI